MFLEPVSFTSSWSVSADQLLSLMKCGSDLHDMNHMASKIKRHLKVYKGWFMMIQLIGKAPQCTVSLYTVIYISLVGIMAAWQWKQVLGNFPSYPSLYVYSSSIHNSGIFRKWTKPCTLIIVNFFHYELISAHFKMRKWGHSHLNIREKSDVKRKIKVNLDKYDDIPWVRWISK